MEIHGDRKTFNAGGAIGAHELVKMSTADVVQNTDEGVPVGAAEYGVAQNAPVAIRLWNSGGTIHCIADAAITAGNAVYAGASGKVSPAGTTIIGYAMEAATADGDIIEVLPTNSTV